MSAQDYVKSQPYETYIRLAMKCERDKNGAHLQNMQNLIWKEQGQNVVANMKHEKLISFIQTHLIKATKAALKWKMEKLDKEKFKKFLPLIEQSHNSDEILNICTEGVEILVKYK